MCVCVCVCVCLCVRVEKACTEMPCSLEMHVFATLEELSYFVLIIINNFGRVTVLYNKQTKYFQQYNLSAGTEAALYLS